MEKKFLKLNDLDAYKISFHLSNYIWDIIINWDYFAKDTVGKQFVRSIDSISANIAEGFGRYNKKDKIKFYRYSFGSLKESLDWNEKAKIRKLLTEEQYNHILEELQRLPKELNWLIKFTNEKLTI
ncbi:MAG: four helix bundle protein [Candidatus Pacebacteria bacterium]|nr:four helix bundle protein [Candidatus Paceibacterota bacterium]